MLRRMSRNEQPSNETKLLEALKERKISATTFMQNIKGSSYEDFFLCKMLECCHEGYNRIEVIKKLSNTRHTISLMLSDGCTAEERNILFPIIIPNAQYVVQYAVKQGLTLEQWSQIFEHINNVDNYSSDLVKQLTVLLERKRYEVDVDILALQNMPMALFEMFIEFMIVPKDRNDLYKCNVHKFKKLSRSIKKHYNYCKCFMKHVSVEEVDVLIDKVLSNKDYDLAHRLDNPSNCFPLTDDQKAKVASIILLETLRGKR